MSQQEIGHRLRLTRQALGLTTTAMCQDMGSSTGGSAYTNYEMGRRRISLDHALALCVKHHLTMDWIYLGDDRNLPPPLRRIINKDLAPERSHA